MEVERLVHYYAAEASERLALLLQPQEETGIESNRMTYPNSPSR